MSRVSGSGGRIQIRDIWGVLNDGMSQEKFNKNKQFPQNFHKFFQKSD